jgi:hypothetical protein
MKDIDISGYGKVFNNLIFKLKNPETTQPSGSGTCLLT